MTRKFALIKLSCFYSEKCLSADGKYLESCSLKWMENSLKLFQSWNLIDSVPFDKDRFYIPKEFDSEAEIDSIVEYINKFTDLVL